MCSCPRKGFQPAPSPALPRVRARVKRAPIWITTTIDAALTGTRTVTGATAAATTTTAGRAAGTTTTITTGPAGAATMTMTMTTAAGVGGTMTTITTAGVGDGTTTTTTGPAAAAKRKSEPSKANSTGPAWPACSASSAAGCRSAAWA